MKRYEFSEGSSNKFWEIELEGTSFTTRFGKIGTDGQTSTKTFGSKGEAEKQYLKIIAEKEKKGYELVEGDEGDDDEDDDDGAPGATNPALEAVVAANPDNSDGWLVYADWLSGQGDPLGEFIAVQVALEKAPGDTSLQARLAKIKEQHEGTFREGMDDLEDVGAAYTWGKYGFMESAVLGSEDEFAEGDADGSEAYAQLLRVPVARFLKTLTFGLFNTEDGTLDYSELIGTVAKKGVPASLRKLVISCFDYQISWAELGSKAIPWDKLAALHEFEMKFGKFELGKIKAPNLRSFEIVTGGFTTGNLKSVAAAEWPNLERLVLYFGVDDYGCDCGVKDLKPILKGANTPKLVELGLCNAEFADALPKALVSSDILPKLKRLDFSQGTMGDAGAKVILDNADSFAHLEKLDLGQNYISTELCDELKKVLPNVNVGAQGEEEDEDDRYVQISE